MKKQPLTLALIILLLTIPACGSDREIIGTAVPEPPTEPPAATATIEVPTEAPPTETPTLAPTNTPRPTNTPAPTPTPAPTLEAHAGRDYVARDRFHLVGEVSNPTDSWFESVKIIATYYDAEGNMLGTDFTYTDLDEIPPHDVGVFELSDDIGGAALDVTSYDLQVQARTTSQPSHIYLNVTVANEYETRGYYHLVGQVENTGDHDCESVKIVAGFYDTEGKVVAVDFTYAELDIIQAGAFSPFDLSKEVPAFDHYKVWVQGRSIRE